MKRILAPATQQKLVAVPAVLPLFQEWLPGPELRSWLDACEHAYYCRVLPPLLVLWGFIYQRLNADHSCDAAWGYLSSDDVQQQFGLKPGRHSESNSAYVQARQRLPESVALGALRAMARACQQKLGAQALWHGYHVNLFDGSTLQLPASQALREHYGVARNQHGASHWPLLRLVAGFDLFSGVVNDVCEGPYSQGEHSLAVPLIRRLGAGYLHVGDRYFGVYHMVQVSVAVQSAVLLRLNAQPAKALAGACLQPGMDLDVVWSRSRHDHCEDDLAAPPIAGRLIYERLERDGFRPLDIYLFTTLSDREAFPRAELLSLYGQRWNVELDLRHVKTTLQMEQLNGKSPDLVRKELYMGLAAYNLLRGLMGEAALRAKHLPMELSLAQCWRRCVDAARALSPSASAQETAHRLDRLLERLGRCRLPKRKRERFEPRAVWGRPRVFPTIKGSRAQTRQAQLDKLKGIS
jgi:Transposase DDE domain